MYTYTYWKHATISESNASSVGKETGGSLKNFIVGDQGKKHDLPGKALRLPARMTHIVITVGGKLERSGRFSRTSVSVVLTETLL